MWIIYSLRHGFQSWLWKDFFLPDFYHNIHLVQLLKTTENIEHPFLQLPNGWKHLRFSRISSESPPFPGPNIPRSQCSYLLWRIATYFQAKSTQILKPKQKGSPSDPRNMGFHPTSIPERQTQVIGKCAWLVFDSASSLSAILKKKKKSPQKDLIPFQA